MGIFLKGFLLSLSLIVAIGAQNAFIIKQGITRKLCFCGEWNLLYLRCDSNGTWDFWGRGVFSEK